MDIQQEKDVVCPEHEQPQTKGQASSRFNFRHCHSVLGILLALLCTLSIVMVNVFAKLCVILPPFEIGTIRFAFHLLLTIPAVSFANNSLVYPPKVIALLVFRAIFGSSGMFARVYAVQNMPLGDATVIIFTSPVFTAIFARIFLKERIHWIYSILLVLCLAGVILIARPTFIFGHPDSLPAYDNVFIPTLVGLLCAIFTSADLVVARILLECFKVPINVILFYFGLVGIVYSVLGSYFDRGFQFPFCKSTDYVYAICVAIFSYFSQVFLNGALKFEKAFIVSLVRSSGIVFGFIFQIIIYSLIPSPLSFGGASMIVLSNLIIFTLKWYQYKRSYEARQGKPSTEKD